MIFIWRGIPQYTQRVTLFLACNFIVLVIKSCMRPVMDCSVRNMWLFRVGKNMCYVLMQSVILFTAVCYRFYCRLLSFLLQSVILFTAACYPFYCSLLSFLLQSVILFTAVCYPFTVSQLQLWNPYHFAEQPSVQVSQTLRPSYISHVTAAAT